MRGTTTRGAGLGVVLLAAVALALGACASNGGGETSGTSGSEPAQTAAPKGVAPPAGHRMAKLELGMGPGDVSAIMGDPTSTQTYMTGMAWVPFYFGSDTHRTDWKYRNQGRVVFGHNRWSGTMKVIRIDYDPSEDGN